MKWTLEETVALIATYQQMLDLQRTGKLGPGAAFLAQYFGGNN